MPTPASERRTLAELVDALHAEGLVPPDDDLAGAELLVGWESAVVRTPGGWIYRFSRLDAAAFSRELAVLRYVDGRLPVPSPRVERVGSRHLVMVYRTLTGHSLDLDRVIGLPTREREPLVRSLAGLLAAVHGCTDAASLDGHPVPMTGYDATTVDRIRAAAAGMESGDRSRVLRLLAEWDRCPLSGRVPATDAPVLLHGDAHAGNMVFASATGPVTGVWDFSCVQLGDPADDFRYLVGDSYPLAAEIAAHYTALTGRSVDLQAARLAGLVEQVSDAVEEGHPVPAALREWAG